MDAKQAVQQAIRHIVELFDAEKLSNIGLEEVGFDQASKQWVVTVGFSRPWDYPAKGNLATLSGVDFQPKRSYKIVRISDSSQNVIEVKNRPVL